MTPAAIRMIVGLSISFFPFQVGNHRVNSFHLFETLRDRNDRGPQQDHK